MNAGTSQYPRGERSANVEYCLTPSSPIFPSQTRTQEAEPGWGTGNRTIEFPLPQPGSFFGVAQASRTAASSVQIRPRETKPGTLTIEGGEPDLLVFAAFFVVGFL